MARRTKQEAQATRQQLLEAAIRVFAEKGVSRTSLQDIAQRAGVSRGAIYWHFANKADLFDAMMESAVLPMEQALQQIGHVAGQDPLHELEGALLLSMRSIASDPRIRAIFEIATLKVEYVDELMTVKARMRRLVPTPLGKSSAACKTPQPTMVCYCVCRWRWRHRACRP